MNYLCGLFRLLSNGNYQSKAVENIEPWLKLHWKYAYGHKEPAQGTQRPHNGFCMTLREQLLAIPQIKPGHWLETGEHPAFHELSVLQHLRQLSPGTFSIIRIVRTGGHLDPVLQNSQGNVVTSHSCSKIFPASALIGSEVHSVVRPVLCKILSV